MTSNGTQEPQQEDTDDHTVSEMSFGHALAITLRKVVTDNVFPVAVAAMLFVTLASIALALEALLTYLYVELGFVATAGLVALAIAFVSIIARANSLRRHHNYEVSAAQRRATFVPPKKE